MARATLYQNQHSTRDGLDKIADDLITRYADALGRGGTDWSVSRKGLEIVIDELKERAPHHAALKRLKHFMEEQDRRSAH